MQGQAVEAINNGGVIRPPLYIPSKRDGGRTATGMLTGTGGGGMGGGGGYGGGGYGGGGGGGYY